MTKEEEEETYKELFADSDSWSETQWTSVLDGLEKKQDKNILAPIDTPSDGLHCRHCGAKKGTTRLCAIMANEPTKTVPFNTPGAVVECWSAAECQGRVKAKSGGGVSQTNFSGVAGNFTYVQKCRHEATAAFELEGLHFFGGSLSKVEDQFFDLKKWLVVSLLGYKSSYDEILWCKFQQWFTALKPFTIKPQVAIDWPDMRAPAIGPGFWNKLVVLARKHKYENILFFCVGGHGRTGTALSSILVECCELTPKEAVKFVRKQYCKEAVETQTQLDYLQMLYKHSKGE